MTAQAPNVDATSRELESHRTSVMKSHVVGGDRPAPQAEQGIDEAERKFNLAGAIEPPYNSNTLVALLEHSNALRQNVDSYSTNIDSFGHRFDPVIDLKAEGALDKVRDLMLSARLRDHDDPRIENPKTQVPPPTMEEVKVVAAELAEQMRLEKMKVEQFFENCSLDFSFVELRKRMRMDKEIMGNAYWEILRQADGQIAQFNYVPGFTMRLMPLDTKLTAVEVRVKVDDLTFGEINILKRFRIYVQVFEGVTVYFKELGDPRFISRMTGRAFKSIEEIKQVDDRDGPATEVIHFKIPSPRSAYGVPRWIGNLLAVLGSRQSEEVNYTYFENKSVPPLALLISGGRVTEETISRIQDYIDNEIKGKRNFHKMLVLEAESAFAQVGEHSGRAKIELKPLTQAQQQDALFQKYDERNIDKVGMSFRLPRLLRGDIRDFNRATADAALRFGEMQVFAPEREEFDWIMNRVILPELGIRFWRFKSQSPILTDPMDVGKLIALLAKEGVLTPEEARELSGDVFNKEIKRLDASWTRQPIALTVAGITPPEPPLSDGEEPDSESGEAADGVKETPPQIKLTSTDLASVVTVNEVRRGEGLGDLMLINGKSDPDGGLTIQEFRAKRTITGEAEGEQEAVKAMVSTDGLASGGGLLLPAQGRRMRRVTPGVAEATVEKDSLLEQATWLLNLRSAMAEAEQADAQRSFTERLKAEADDFESGETVEDDA